MCEINYEWRDDDPDHVPGVTDHSYLDDPMEILSDQTFLDWVEGKDLQ